MLHEITITDGWAAMACASSAALSRRGSASFAWRARIASILRRFSTDEIVATMNGCPFVVRPSVSTSTSGAEAASAAK